MDSLHQQYKGDQQGFLYAEAMEILKGNIDKALSEDHLAAVSAELRHKFNDINLSEVKI